MALQLRVGEGLAEAPSEREQRLRSQLLRGEENYQVVQERLPDLRHGRGASASG